MTPSPQEVAALVERLKMILPYGLGGADRREAAAALIAQAARIAELERECAELRNAMDAVAHIRTTNWADERTLLERECAELRKDAARLDAVLGWTKTGWGCWWNYRKIKTRQEIDLCLTVSITSAAISAKPMEESI